MHQNENMNKILLLLFLAGSSLHAQTRIDATMSFQTDPNKKYSIYLPSNYDVNSPNKMMLALHPWNVNRWDAKSWCDTLVNFAEANDLILIAPDGGSDGQVDDAIDTAFTTAILDSMEVWYSINTDKVYIMGFSWGGKTTYTYGLSNSHRFGGYIPIGAAVAGAGEISGVAANANGEAFYVVHGNNDSPNTRFHPLVGSLNNNNAIVEMNLIPGVGHTIDFPNRNTILSRAFFWVDSVNCEQLSGLSIVEGEDDFKNLDIYPNPIKTGNTLKLSFKPMGSSNYSLRIVDLNGRLILKQQMQFEANQSFLKIETKGMAAGQYLLFIENSEQKLKANLTLK